MREKATDLPVPAILICLFFTLSTMGCELLSSDDEPFDKIDPMVQPPPPIEMTLELQKHDVPLFQPVTMKLRIRNTSDTTIDLGLPGGGRPGIYYNFIVASTDSLQVWNRLYDEHPIQYGLATSHHLDAGETLTYEYTWDQKDLNDNLVRKGTYEVYGAIWLDFTVPASGEDVHGDFATEPGTIVID